MTPFAMTPKVSVIMPVLNGKNYIAQAIQSIVAQTYPPFELIVVDDGSTDGTRDAIERFSNQIALRIVRHDAPRGIGPSVNDGIRHSSGDMIAFLDHDDTWLPDFLKTQVTYLEEHPDVGMVHADFQTIDGDGAVIEASVSSSRQRIEPSGHVFPQLFMHSLVCGNTVLIRRECFEHVGGFDESLRYGDYHLWMRIARRYRIDYNQVVLTQYRQHAGQQTRSASASDPVQDSVELMAIKKIVAAYPEVYQELGSTTVRRRIAGLYYEMACGWFEKQVYGNARVCVVNALRLWPANSRFLMLYLASLLRPAQVMAMRQAWRRVRGLPAVS